MTPHRLIILAPTAKAVVVATWMNANLGVNTVPVDLGPGLSADGTGIPTHNWCCIALDDAQAKAVLTRLCTLAGVAQPTPAQWNNATNAQRRTWWQSVRSGVWTNFTVWVQLADNGGQWDDPAAALALRGMKAVGNVVVVNPLVLP